MFFSLNIGISPYFRIKNSCHFFNYISYIHTYIHTYFSNPHQRAECSPVIHFCSLERLLKVLKVLLKLYTR
jgi:hypothetical protein